MVMSMFIFILFFGNFMKNVITYNPLLTYTMRYHKVTYSPNITAYCIIDQYRNQQYISGNVTINSKYTINTAILVINRCDSEGIDCEYFQSWKLTHFCSMLKQKNQIWSTWFGAFDPPVECPILKNYQVINATFDIDGIIRWYPDVPNYQWKITTQLYSDNILIGSYTIHHSIFGYRKRVKSLLSH